jgi:hypothetical protein
LSVLNGLRDVSMARLALIEEAEKRSKQTWSVAVISGYAFGRKVLKCVLSAHPFKAAKMLAYGTTSDALFSTSSSIL